MFDVFVPKAGTRAAGIVAPKSAIVAAHEQPDCLLGTDQALCYFEGNLYGAVNLQSFSERLLSAAGRALQRYPTVAKSFFNRSDLVLVGYYDFEQKHLVVIDRRSLKDWLGDEMYEGLSDERRLAETDG